jgi:hypothetical protein
MRSAQLCTREMKMWLWSQFSIWTRCAQLFFYGCLDGGVLWGSRIWSILGHQSSDGDAVDAVSVNGAGEIFVKVGDRPVIYGWNLEFIGSLLLQVKQNKNNVKLFFFLEVVFTIKKK